MSGYSENARVPVFDGKLENFDRWEIQWNAFVEVEGISGALGNVFDTNMPATSSVPVVLAEEVLLIRMGKANTKTKAVKDHKKYIAFNAIALKQMQLLRLLTKTQTDEWPGGEAWKLNTLHSMQLH
jgi:hypothetical protein